MRNIAHERVILLFNMAFERARKGDFDLARRYVEIALRIAGKAKIKIPVKYKETIAEMLYTSNTWLNA
jgi:RNase P subunit RPR2